MVSRSGNTFQPGDDSVSETSSRERDDASVPPDAPEAPSERLAEEESHRTAPLPVSSESVSNDPPQGPVPEPPSDSPYASPGMPYGVPHVPYGMPPGLPSDPYGGLYPTGQYNGVPPMYPYPYPYSPYAVPYGTFYNVPGGVPGYPPPHTVYPQEGHHPNSSGENVHGSPRAVPGGWPVGEVAPPHGDKAAHLAPPANRGDWNVSIGQILSPPIFPPYGPPPERMMSTESGAAMNVAISRPNRSKVGRPVNEKRRAERREQILSAAVRMFAERGFAGSRMQDLADQLGVAKGTIFHYFPTKEDLFFQTCRYYCFDRMFAYLEKVGFLRATNPVQALYTTIRASIEYCLANPDTVELLVLERAYFRDGVPESYQEARNQYRQGWLEGIQRMLGSGWFREGISAERIFDIFNYLTYGMFFLNRRETMLATTPHEQASSITRVVAVGVLRSDHMEQLDEYISSAELEMLDDQFPDSAQA